MLLARCVWIEDNEDGRKSLDTLARVRHKKKSKDKSKFTVEQATKAHRGSRVISLLFL
jgi:hypothetical protein